MIVLRYAYYLRTLMAYHFEIVHRSLKPAVGLLCLASACFAAAKPPFLKVFFNVYKIKETSAIGKARCLNCHLPPGPPKRNPYGLAVQDALRANHARMVTPEMLLSIEKKNMGDGMTFVAKIKKDLMPGVAAPKKKAIAKPKAKAAGKKHALLLPNPSQNTGALMLLSLSAIGLGFCRKRN